MNYSHYEIDDILPSPSNIQISKSSSSNFTGKKKNFLLYKRITTYIEMEKLGINISEISNKFLENFPNEEKVKNFKNKYQLYLNGNYNDIVLLIKDFPEFNIYDYIGVYNQINLNKTDKKKLIQARNNILLSILIAGKQIQILEKKFKKNLSVNSSEKIENKQNSNDEENSFTLFNLQKNKKEKISEFQNLNFLNPIADDIKMFIIEDNGIEFPNNSLISPKKKKINDSKISINCVKEDLKYDYEVEVFFLALLNYKSKSNVIKQKNNLYFRNFINKLSLTNNFSFDTFIEGKIENKNITEFTKNEIILIRKILTKTIKRKFYLGIEYFSKDKNLNFFLSEGRIWKTIGFYFEKNQAYELWNNYYQNIQKDIYLKQEITLKTEYKNKLLKLKKEYEELNQNEEKDLYKINRNLFLKQEIKKLYYLPFVTSFKDLITIFFKYDLKELSLYFIEEFYLKKNNKKVPLEIFNICLDNDENISIMLIDKSLNQKNISELYMSIALLKKYFRLAKCLLKFKVCKNFLNSPPPKSEDYIYLIYKQQNKLKHEKFMKILYTKDRENEGDDLINFLKEEIKPFEYNNQDFNNLINIRNLDNSSQHLKHINYLSSIIESFQNTKKAKCKFKSNILTNPYIYSNFIYSSNPSSVNEFIKVLNHIQTKNNFNLLSLNKTTIILKKKIINSSPLSSFLDKNSNIKSCNTGILNIKEEDENEKKSENNDIKILNTETIKKDKNNSKKEKEDKKKKSVFNKKPIKRGHSLDLLEKKRKKRKKISPKRSIIESEKDLINTSNLNSLIKINVQLILIDNLRYGEYLFDSLNLLSQINIQYINLDYVEKTCKNLLCITSTEDLILKCHFPLVSIALAIEYLNKIGSISLKIKNKTEVIANELFKFGECIQSSLKDEDILNFFLREQTDYIGRSALEIYAENNFSILLRDSNVGDLIGKIWYGNGKEEKFFHFFRLTRILKANINYENYHNVIDINYTSRNSIYSFQFYHFIQNSSIRFIISNVAMIMSTIINQIIVFFYVNNIQKEENKTYYCLIIISHYFAYSTILSYVFCAFYHYKTGRRLRINLLEMITNLIFLLFTILSLVNYKKLYNKEKDEKKYFLITGIINSIIITTSWLRFVIIILRTKVYGSFFRSLFQIFFHVSAFLLITFCFTFLFAQIFTIFFQKTNNDFEYIYKGFIALFNSAFGQIEFDNFSQMKLFGYILLMSYTVISNIMLFNLIVCIINNLFELYEEKSNTETRSDLILVHERIKWDEKFGLIIVCPAPFNFCALIFIIILIIYSHYNEDEKVIKLNYCFSKILYFFVAFIYFVLMLFIGIIIYPFALIKSIYHSIYESSNYFCFYETILIFIQRPFSLFFYFCQDLYIFWTLVYKQPINISEDKIMTNQKIAKEYILALRKVLTRFKYKEKKRIISRKELYFKLGLDKKNNLTLNTISNSTPNNNNNNNNINFNTSSPKSSNSPSPINKHTLHFTITNYNEQLNAKETMKTLINKIVDDEGYIDIDRTFIILPFRIQYSEQFLRYLNFFSVRIFKKGVSKYFFKTNSSNIDYLFKKLQLMINKLWIKFKIIYTFLPKDIYELLNNKFKSLNNDPKYLKNGQIFLINEQKEEESEYDITENFRFYSENISSK